MPKRTRASAARRPLAEREAEDAQWVRCISRIGSCISEMYENLDGRCIVDNPPNRLEKFVFPRLYIYRHIPIETCMHYKNIIKIIQFI